MNIPSQMRTLGAAALAALLVFWLHEGPVVARRPPEPTVHDVKRLIDKYYVREVDPTKLEEAAIRGMVATLDPYSSYMPPQEAKDFRDDTDGKFGGLGIEITVEQGLVRVIAPLEGTPAFEAGILPGDRIIEIDGVAYEFGSATEAAHVLKGPPGSDVTLTVLHEGATEPVTIRLKRAVIRVHSVKRPEIVDPRAGIGYVRISQFGPKTGEELAEALERLEQKGIRALVIDLRSNPGGHLDAALKTADLFIDEGVILRTEGRFEHRIHMAHRNGTNTTLRLAVLVNGFSASAAEIVAGALQDAGRATIIGTRTFGKGSVQQLIPLGRQGKESLLRLTTALWYTRSGRPIHRHPGAGPDDPWGIKPDVEVELDPAELQRIYRARAANGYRKHNGSIEPPWQSHDPELSDPQLEAALETLKKQLGKASQ